MTQHTLTFVYGMTHYAATLYIREQVKATGRNSNEYRNITNPESARGLTTTDKTTIEFIWLRGCMSNPTYAEMRRNITGARGIVEKFAQ